ncbi:unnamed protein product [Rotaria sordida]|uniref:Protein F37C4.5 n=1 Tax=Rotaria sordida TaxID=392033 RepID=A0A818RM30_9BILA|nr:unnamed protein product [Rotaria sordida]CAF3656016.1 unnamed protein product [Rotaria sordida]
MAETILTTNTPPSATIVHINIKQECPVQFVTVYNDRAELTRLLRYHFDNEGTYDLVLQGLSPCIDLTSFRVSGGTGKACTILEVSYQKRYEDPSTSLSDTTPLDQLQTQLDIVQADIDEHAQELDRLKKQRTWLDGRASKLMNQEGPLSTSDLETMEQFLNFYHKMFSKIDKETTQEQRQLKELNSRCDALTVKINEHGSQAMINRRIEQREVTITIHVASSKTDVALEVSYLISNCSWSASYDIRVDSGEGRQPKTQLTYYGIIINKSQENWSDTQFSLSTATPSLGGSAPKLATLKVNNRQYHGVPQRFMSSAAQSDIFDLPLGIDSGIKIEYKPVKKTSDTQGIISKTHLKTVRHETHITNTKTHEVAVYIYDQLPLSSDEKIKVNLIQPDLRRKDNNPHNTITLKDTNNLEWKCILPSRGECRLLFEYSVEWPYDKQVEFQEEL